MSTPAPSQVTLLLAAWRNGEQAALDKLVPLVEAELHRLAHHYLRREQAGHMLQTTALVNEAYLRLIGQSNVPWQNRAHFCAVAAQVMRRVLVDYARRQHRAKRGGGAQQVSLDEAAVVSAERSIELLALDEALTRLAAMDVRQSRVVELRYFSGLSVEETAEVLGVSVVTVMREWRLAKAWLQREISGEIANHDA